MEWGGGCVCVKEVQNAYCELFFLQIKNGMMVLSWR